MAAQSLGKWKRFIAHLLCAFGLGTFVNPVWAILGVGDSAPEVVAKAALAGKVTNFRLTEQLKKGPVVLYFYPKAYTKGCTVEAQLFAENINKFSALGATVIGVSNDSIETLQAFSQEACRNAFMVASDPDNSAIKAYKTKPWWLPVSKRVTYVIIPDQKIWFVHSGLSPEEHIHVALSALQAWKDRRK